MGETIATVNSSSENSLNSATTNVIFKEIKRFIRKKGYEAVTLTDTNGKVQYGLKENEVSPILYTPDIEHAERIKGKYIYAFRTSYDGVIRFYSEIYADNETGEYKYYDVNNDRKETNIVHPVFDFELRDTYYRDGRQQTFERTYFFYLTHFRLSRDRVEAIREGIKEDALNYSSSIAPCILVTRYQDIINSERESSANDASVLYLVDYVEIAHNLYEEYLKHRNRYIEWTEKDEYRNHLKVISDMINGLCKDVSGYRGNIKNYRLPLEYYMVTHPLMGGLFTDDEIDEFVKSGDRGPIVSRFNHILKTDAEIEAYEPNNAAKYANDYARWRQDYIDIEQQLVYNYEKVAELLIVILKMDDLRHSFEDYTFGSFDAAHWSNREFNENELKERKYLDEGFSADEGKNIKEYLFGSIIHRLGESKAGQKKLMSSLQKVIEQAKSHGFTFGVNDRDLDYEDAEELIREIGLDTIESNIFFGFMCTRRFSLGAAQIFEAMVPYVLSIRLKEYFEISGVLSSVTIKYDALTYFNYILKRRANFVIEVDGDEVFRLWAGKGNSTYQNIEVFCKTDSSAYPGRGLKLTRSIAFARVLTAIEVINVVASVIKLAQVKSFGEALYGVTDLIGSSLDLASQMAVYANSVKTLGSTADDIFVQGGSLVAKKLSTTGLAVIGVISGVIDATLSYVDAGGAFSEGDSDRGWAHIVEGTGAVIMAVGAIVTIAAPPIGALIILIGVIVRLLGGIWAFFATDDDRDKWLKHCVWGVHFHSEHDERPDWALKPFLEWDDAPAAFTYVPEIYSKNTPSALYKWAGDIETQIKSFNRLIFNYKIEINYDENVVYDLFNVTLLTVEITLSSYLINPKLLLTIRVKHPDKPNDSPDNFTIINNKNVFEVPEVRIITEKEQKKVFLYWCDLSQGKTKEYRMEQIRKAYYDQADTIIPHIIWVYNLHEEMMKRFVLLSWRGIYGYFETQLTADNLHNDIFRKSDVVGIKRPV
ncbi:MAG: hypothetical protein JXB88_27380 [Spirochaetales bacterium]|nr:hypothetical protein [Spirochaetales bacterium]